MMLCITGDRDAPAKKDFKYVFDPECKTFMKLHGIPDENRLKVNLGFVSATHRADEVLNFIKTKLVNNGPATLAFFCHGLSFKVQVGFTKQNVDALSSTLREALGPDVRDITIILYCCSTGATPVGFADALRDSLCRYSFINCRVMAHKNAGHSVKNPNVLFFDGLGSPVGGVGGIEVVKWGSTLWRKWVGALKTDFRFLFPFLSIAEIHSQLLAL